MAGVVSRSVGNQCGSDRENLSKLEIRAETQQYAVVSGRRSNPVASRSTYPRIVGKKKVHGHLGNHRQLVVNNRNGEGRDRGIAAGIGSGVNHRADSSLKERSVHQRRIKRCHAAIVGSSRLDPGRNSATFTWIICHFDR